MWLVHLEGGGGGNDERINSHCLTLLSCRNTFTVGRNKTFEIFSYSQVSQKLLIVTFHTLNQLINFDTSPFSFGQGNVFTPVRHSAYMRVYASMQLGRGCVQRDVKRETVVCSIGGVTDGVQECTPPNKRWPLKWVVCILLECILVSI